MINQTDILWIVNQCLFHSAAFSSSVGLLPLLRLRQLLQIEIDYSRH